MRLFVLRHDERPSDDARFITCLTVNGRRKAASTVLDALGKLQIDKVFSSPYPRCIQTVLPFCWSRNLPINVDYSLYEDVNDRDDQHDLSEFPNTLTVREMHMLGVSTTYKSLELKEPLEVNSNLERVTEFVTYLRRMYSGTNMNVLICTHLSCINTALGRAKDEPFEMGTVAEIK